MLGGTVAAGSPGGDSLLTVTVARDHQGYGMKVSGDKPVYVQSVKEHGAAWRAGLRAGDRILRVDSVPVHHHTHQQVVQLLRANPSPVLTVQQNSSRYKTPITAPQPVNPEKQRQLEASKAHTFRLMLEQEQKYIRDLRNELLKVPDVRKQADLESAEQRCSNLQHMIDNIVATQPEVPQAPPTPKMGRAKDDSPQSFLSGLPRSLSNLTSQSLRNLRQARQGRQDRQDRLDPAPLVRQNSDENGKRRHNNTVPMVPTTCLDNTPPPLPPRTIRTPPTPCPPAPKPSTHKYKGYGYREDRLRRSSHSLDGELEGPQPNSIAVQMNYPLVNVPPPPLQTDNRSGLPILHVRSQSSPEHLDHELPRSLGERPPGTPPPPYPHQPCPDPQRAIISMEEDDSPASDNSTYSGLFSNLRSVRESKARMAVLINWLLGERRCACASLLLVLTDAYRAAPGVTTHTLRRWAYEIQSTFLMPNAVLQLNGVDENMANEIDHVLMNEYDKEEILRNVFRKARRQAKEELARQLSEFQVKRQVGLATLYGPHDDVLQRCDVDKQQELVVVERLMSERLKALAAPPGPPAPAPNAPRAPRPADAHHALLAALSAAALCLGSSEIDAREVRRKWWQSPRTNKKKTKPATVASAVGGARASFLQRDKLYKQRVKQLAKQNPQPFVVRGHHLQLQALTAANHCHHCEVIIWGIAPQAYVCTDCNLRVHRACARAVEEGCVLDHGDHAHNRISRLMERIHTPGQDSSDKKSRKSSGSSHFLNMERSFRKAEDVWDQSTTPLIQERRDESDESLYESADGHSDAISASDDAISRLGKTPTISKESLKLAVTDEEIDYPKAKNHTHRKTMSLSHPFDIVKSFGDELFDHRREDKNSDKKKSRESLWSEEDRESIHGSTVKLDMNRKNSKKDEEKKATSEVPKRKTSKGSSVGALSFLRRKKTPTSMKAVEAVVEVVDGLVNTNEILNHTKFFLEEEKRYAAVCQSVPPVETDSEEERPAPKIEHRRRLSRQTSRSKSKVRGKSQSVRVNTLRKSHSGTLKKGKKKSMKVPPARSRQASIVEPSPLVTSAEVPKQNSWLFSGSRGETRREGSTDEPAAPDPDVDSTETTAKETPEKEHEKNWRGVSRGVNRAESCRERDAPRRGKHRNASDPNRLTAHPAHDLEPGATAAPSGSSSSSSLSSRSNESNTLAPDNQASQSDWSEEEDPLAVQWSDSLPPHVRDTLVLSARLRKRQEVIHELIVSEGSHVRWLKVLGVDFLKPLERQPSLLPPEELRALFPNLPSVRERHSRLYSELRAARNEAPNHVVQIRPIADAVLNTLGDAGYAPCLSKFCRGQRLALDGLRERRRKHKELQAFLAGREQLPRCGRLQLRDLLACVWQRLTKYQLLLEGILKTVSEEGCGEAEGEGVAADSADDTARLRRALCTAKEVLHSVDTAIRTAENEHRLRTIQSKLEVRVGTLERQEAEELRRMDLTQHSLRYEGELSLRIDNKKLSVLALLLEDSLVLLQREGERFLLRPIATPSGSALLLPVIKWDKVLFRPNAAVRNTFFLMNINSVQMHELSAHTAAEYATWVKHIQESPLARLAESKPVAPHPPADHHGTNVSRNPSDASEKSAASDRLEEVEVEEEKGADKGGLKEDEEEVEKGVREEKGPSTDKQDHEDEQRVSCISTHEAVQPPPLEARAQVCAAPAGGTAARALTTREQLRRLDDAVARGLRAKCAVVADLLGVPRDSYHQLAEISVEDTLGQIDVYGELRAPCGSDEPDIDQLLLAAQAQANQLTEAVSAAMSVGEGAAIAARAGRCDRCRAPRPRPAPARADHAHNTQRTGTEETPAESEPDAPAAESSRLSDTAEEGSYDAPADFPNELPNDALQEGGCGRSEWAARAGEAGAAALAARLSGAVGGLQATLGALLAVVTAREAERRALRRELAVARERADRDYYNMTTEILPKGNMDQPVQDQPSNGG